MTKQMIDTLKNKAPRASKVLKQSNAHLRSSKADKLRIRSLASSTAIETGETIISIEGKLHKLNANGFNFTLA